MTPVAVREGDGPVVLGFPHDGTWLPDPVREALNARGRELADTDWRIARLYDGLLPGATTVRATFHRYLIDANRDPDGASLYPGQNTTGLIPMTDFDGEAIWRVGHEPDAEAVEDRRARYHAPYHAALAAQLERVRARWGVAVLYDCHSIRSAIPFLFEGALPVFNIGTDGGRTCDPHLEAEVWRLCRQAESTVLNGRFRGGWTTRRYGRPEDGFHAIQMELAQRAYLTEEAPPWRYDGRKAARLRKTLGEVLDALDAWGRGEAGGPARALY